LEGFSLGIEANLVLGDFAGADDLDLDARAFDLPATEGFDVDSLFFGGCNLVL
jgi:hypothetical protein